MQWKRRDSGTSVRFFQFSRKLSKLYFFRPTYLFALFILFYSVTCCTCLVFPPLFRSRTSPVARLVNVQFTDVEKSSRSRFLLKFLQNFSQIIILILPISRFTLNPWFMLFLFPFSLILQYILDIIFEVSFDSFPYYITVLRNKRNIVQRKIEHLQCFFFCKFERIRQIIIFYFPFPSLFIILLKDCYHCQTFWNFFSFVSNVYYIFLLCYGNSSSDCVFY